MNRKQRRAVAKARKRRGATAPAMTPGGGKGFTETPSPNGSGGHAGAALLAGQASALHWQGQGAGWQDSPTGRAPDKRALFSAQVRHAVHLARKGGADEAMEALRDALDLLPGNAGAWNDVGVMAFNIGKFYEASEILSHAIELDPSLAEAPNNLGTVYLEMHRLDDAIEAFKKALQMKPDFMEPHINLCRTLRQVSEWDQALEFAYRALALPGYGPEHFHYPSQVFSATCDFAGLAKIGDVWEHCDQVPAATLPSMFLQLLVFADDEASVWRFHHLVRRWGEYVEKQADGARIPVSAKRPGDEKLRIGILSSDLRAHSIAKFLLPLIESYDRNRFEFFCYAPYRVEGDPTQPRFMEHADKFTFISNMTGWEIASTIREDGIDILIELNGFTQGRRIAALAYKPAPVQMTWIGYPFTCGLKAIDYCIMDPFLVPEDEKFMVEEPIVMPHSWLCFGDFADVGIEEGLPADRYGAITFGTLNNPYKFTEEMIALWARVMNEVPDSRFLVVRPEASSSSFRENFSDEFARHGVSADRLVLFDNRERENSHLSYYNDIDISLDTFPLTGGTTTCEATWMGVPVITLVGPSYHQRLSLSMLMNCGLEELCTFTPDAFVEKAVGLADERDKLLAWRHGLREMMRQSPLCDEERFVDDFQTMLDQVADLHGLRVSPAPAGAE